jgi:hypothetical protein
MLPQPRSDAKTRIDIIEEIMCGHARVLRATGGSIIISLFGDELL